MKIGLLGAALIRRSPVFLYRARQGCVVRVAAAVLVNYDLGGGQGRTSPQGLSAPDLSFDRPRPTLFRAAEYSFFITTTLTVFRFATMALW